MKKANILSILAMASMALFAACDEIEENERITEGDKTPFVFTPDTLITNIDGKLYTFVHEHKLLIEDFTGWKCVNCPVIADYIAQNISHNYPSIVVGLHPDGNKALSSTAGMPFGLSTTLADEYLEAYTSESAANCPLPSININRSGIVNGDMVTVQNNISGKAYQYYLAYNVNEEKPIISLSIHLAVNEDGSYDIATAVLSEDETTFTNLKLQLWLVENGIQGLQFFTSGALPFNHNHVLREAINGAWGETIELSPITLTDQNENLLNLHGTITNRQYTLPTGSIPENCEIVAFVYNEENLEVLNTTKVSLKETL